MTEQLTLPIGRLTQQENTSPTLTLQQKFEAFHEANPWVYNSLEVLADDWLQKGHTRIGMKMLTEILRWQYERQTVGDEFKLNNSMTSRYARLLIDNHPEWADAIETRRLRAA